MSLKSLKIFKNNQTYGAPFRKKIITFSPKITLTQHHLAFVEMKYFFVQHNFFFVYMKHFSVQHQQVFVDTRLLFAQRQTICFNAKSFFVQHQIFVLDIVLNYCHIATKI